MANSNQLFIDKLKSIINLTNSNPLLI